MSDPSSTLDQDVDHWNQKLQSTIQYYDKHADEYYSRTVNADLSDARNRFLTLVEPGGKVLDAGCGSGRDLREFRLRGFAAMGIDASEALVEMARAYSGAPCEVGRLETLTLDQAFDGIWACASLLHFPKELVGGVVARLRRALVPHGVLFASVQIGTREEIASDGRLFATYQPDEFLSIVTAAGFVVFDTWVSADALSQRRPVQWFSVLGRA